MKSQQGAGAQPVPCWFEGNDKSGNMKKLEEGKGCLWQSV